MSKEPNHYKLLQVDPEADVLVIRYAYRYLVSKYHPDNLETGDKQVFDKLTEAKVLCDETRRAAYDKTLRENNK